MLFREECDESIGRNDSIVSVANGSESKSLVWPAVGGRRIKGKILERDGLGERELKTEERPSAREGGPLHSLGLIPPDPKPLRREAITIGLVYSQPKQRRLKMGGGELMGWRRGGRREEEENIQGQTRAVGRGGVLAPSR